MVTHSIESGHIRQHSHNLSTEFMDSLSRTLTQGHDLNGLHSQGATSFCGNNKELPILLVLEPKYSILASSELKINHYYIP